MNFYSFLGKCQVGGIDGMIASRFLSVFMYLLVGIIRSVFLLKFPSSSYLYLLPAPVLTMDSKPSAPAYPQAPPAYAEAAGGAPAPPNVIYPPQQMPNPQQQQQPVICFLWNS